MTKKCLELFCGTKSVGKIFENVGYDVISLDYNPKFNATHVEDFLTWNYKQYNPHYFDVIWASPDCRTWSLASGGKYRTKNNIYGLNNDYQEQATQANNMILKLIEIIKYFKCKAWFIENPKALLVHYPPLKEFVEEQNANVGLVYYGNYNDWGCFKPTYIWSNLPLWIETKPVLSADKYYIKHHNYNGRDKKYYIAFWNKNAEERSKIPPDLINRLRLLIPDEV